MEIIKYLEQIKLMDTKIDSKIKELDELKALSESVSCGFGQVRVQHSLRHDSIARIVAKIADLENEINAEIDRFVDIKHQVINDILSLEDGAEVSVLFKRYIEYKTFSEISLLSGISLRHAFRLHDRALKSLAENIGERAGEKMSAARKKRTRKKA